MHGAVAERCGQAPSEPLGRMALGLNRAFCCVLSWITRGNVTNP